MSEIARIKTQIDQEVAAMRQGLTGFASVARHQAITHRYNTIGEQLEHLRGQVGDREAFKMVLEEIDRGLKPGLGDLRREHHLDAMQLARAAGLPLREVYLAEIGGAIDREQAMRLLDALNKLTGRRYTLEMVSANLKEVALADQPTRPLPNM